ncbi:SIR2 family NAD-dependent protein deacylase [Algoriphagus zhangzhouensis]|uniref:NAD-dependent protein deacylase n=1 Tax=Algoriphagus zhangzhouensis TaxID=1073327 RepID=A0A1M7Z6X7_9BACT|nr:NAD-dependent deacylase [Algoriphagus zhangzhouensis]TDY49275.1 NAD-dependent deacetylase [Algoriphagus zhangzhouensis]SHO60698.1 NAD-dependent deacetylase [Algoriphagus zhangzhouensis]
MNKKRLVVLSGAGISAESGIKTFRDSGGLWEGHDVMEVASPEGWRRNQDLVQEFYNLRRKQARECLPNLAHELLVELESNFEVLIITQNVDDLHERAGSSKVLHLHGELNKAQSSLDPNLVYELDHWEIKKGDKCEKGSQLRPNVVWFGEPVPKMLDAIKWAEKADIFLVIGTSLQVYPAAGLVDYAPTTAPIYLIDPNSEFSRLPTRITHLKNSATEGMKILKDLLIPEI